MKKSKVKIYVLGNPDMEIDNKAILAAKKLKNFEGLEFIFINPNEDLPPEKILTLIDTVVGLPETILLTEKDLKDLILSPRGSVHDFDLGWQLRYLMKLGVLKKVRIVGLPAEKDVDYGRIQSILRKLVAQDMQGS